MSLNPLSLVSSALGGVWGYVAAAAIAGGLAAGACHYVDSKAYGLTISNLKLDASKQQVVSISASLAQLQSFIASMHNADVGYNAALDALAAKFAPLQKELQDAIAAKPLPVDCRPDSGRLRVLTDAVAAANNPASTGK